MGLPSQRSDDDSALVDEIIRSIDGADDPKRVRSLLNAWWRYAGVRAAAGAEVDAEKFLAERSALGLLELPVATSRAVIELEFAIANGPQGPLPVVVAPELTPAAERPIAVVRPAPEPEPQVVDEPVAAAEPEVVDEPAVEAIEDPVAAVESEVVDEPEIEAVDEAVVEAEPEPGFVAEAEPELEAEAELEAEPEIVVEAEPEPVAEPEPEVVAAAEPEPEPEIVAEVEPEASPELEVEDDLEAAFAADAAYETQVEAELDWDPEPDGAHELEPEIDLDHEPEIEDPPVPVVSSENDRFEDRDPVPPVLAVVPDPESEPDAPSELDAEPAAEASDADAEPVADEELAPIPVAALLAHHDLVDPPEEWEALDEPVPITHFERFRRDRADRSADGAERAKLAVYAGLIVFFALAIGIAIAASLVITHISLPGSDAVSTVAPWRAWLAIVTGVAGVVVATVIARRHGLQQVLFGPRIGLGGLAVTGIGLLAGSVIAAGAGGVVLLGGAALGAVRRT